VSILGEKEEKEGELNLHTGVSADRLIDDDA